MNQEDTLAKEIKMITDLSFVFGYKAEAGGIVSNLCRRNPFEVKVWRQTIYQFDIFDQKAIQLG